MKETSGTLANLITQAIHCQQGGRFPEAEHLFHEALQADALQPDALHFLGLLEFQTERTQSGLEKMRQSVERVSGNAGFRYNFANALLTAGRDKEAIEQFRHCCALEPSNADASQGLAMALSSQHEPEEAVDVLLQALAKQPRHRSCWMTLSIIQENMNLLPEATAAARHALRLTPQDPELQVRLASLLLIQDRPEEAGKLLGAAMRASPKLPQAHYHHANLLMYLGKFAEAQAELEQVIALDRDFTEAYIRLATIGKLHVGTPLQEQLEARIESAHEDMLENKLNIRFALGKAWQTKGDYQRAFHHFEIGNRLRRASLDYSTREERERTDRIMVSYDAAFLKRSAACGLESDTPIFIVGMARSGTSLAEQILSRHPEVHAGGELPVLQATLYRRLGAAFRKDPQCSPATLSNAELGQIGRRCLADMQALAPAARHITDKLPSNYLRIGLIHALYPQARIIHCYRDARDNCVSQYTTLFGTGHAYTSDLAELGEYYRMYQGLMGHWRKILPAGILLDLRYEDVIEDTETQVRRLLTHCRLDWDPVCLDITGGTRPVRTASVYQVRQPIYHSSASRWRHYESYIAPLLKALEGVA